MSNMPDILRSVSLWAFAGLCVVSYFSGTLLALLARKIRQTSWEGASAPVKLAYRLLRAFREYVANRDEDPALDQIISR
jgi:hypothetical protein